MLQPWCPEEWNVSDGQEQCSLSLASGLLQLDFGSQWFGEPHIVCLLSVCYRVSVETEEKEKLVFGGCEGLVLALDQENPE